MTVVETLQHAFEHNVMLALFEKHDARRVLEVGIWEGGTLWHWLQHPGATVVAVDMHIKYPDLFHEWADEAGSTLHLVAGDSANATVVEQVAEHAPYDFVFIDGDHGYHAVANDWANYRPLVEPGGIMAFHDVHRNCGAAQLWTEIKASDVQTVEILAGPESDRGIGMVWC